MGGGLAPIPAFIAYTGRAAGPALPFLFPQQLSLMTLLRRPISEKACRVVVVTPPWHRIASVIRSSADTAWEGMEPSPHSPPGAW